MNPNVEVIKLKVGTDVDFDEYRFRLKRFAEHHKIISITTAMDVQGLVIYATILYE